jgi:hypothetical protein
MNKFRTHCQDYHIYELASEEVLELRVNLLGGQELWKQGTGRHENQNGHVEAKRLARLWNPCRKIKKKPF